MQDKRDQKTPLRDNDQDLSRRDRECATSGLQDKTNYPDGEIERTDSREVVLVSAANKQDVDILRTALEWPNRLPKSMTKASGSRVDIQSERAEESWELFSTAPKLKQRWV